MSFLQRKSTLIWWLSLCVGLAVLSAPLASNASGRGFDRIHLGATLPNFGYEVVELRRTDNNHLFLFGKIDGRRRSCLIDSGWSYTTVSTNTGARLAPTNTVRTLTLGRVVRTNVVVRIEDLRVNGQPTAYDVVLGADFLRANNAVLDCVGRRLYFRSEGLIETEQVRLDEIFSRAGWAAVELRQLQPPAWTCLMEGDGQKVELLLDSGATWSCLDEQLVNRSRWQKFPTAARISGPNANRQQNINMVELKQWTLGSRAMKPTSFAVFSLKELGMGPDGKLFPEVGGILGAAELFQMQAVIDCGRSRVWVRGN